MRLFLILLLSCFLSSCDDCRGTTCFFEGDFVSGPRFLTERSAPQNIKSARGIADAYTGSRNQSQFDWNSFYVRTQNFNGFEAVQQREEWCWAAAVSMVLDYQGIALSQCQVLRSLGRDCNSEEAQLGSRSSILNSLSGLQFNRFERPSAVTATTLATGNGTPLIEDLATNWPPIVGLNARRDRPGHVYVLTGIEYSWKPGTWNTPVIWEVQLYDPWDGQYVSMSGSEFDELFDFAARVRVQHG